MFEKKRGEGSPLPRLLMIPPLFLPRREHSLDWGPGGGPDLIVDEGGDATATLLIHDGVKAEEIFEKTGQFPDRTSIDNLEFHIMLSIIRDGLQADLKKYHKMKERLVGVFGETTTAAGDSTEQW